MAGFYNQHTQSLLGSHGYKFWKPSVVQGLIVCPYRILLMLNYSALGKRKWNHSHLLDIFVKYQNDFVDEKEDPENRQNTTEKH
jgi:hypothetical protein